MLFDYFAGVDADGIVRQQRRQPVPNLGPPPDVDYGLTYHYIPSQIDWGAQRSPTSVLQWSDGDPQWVEAATLDDLKTAAIADIDHHADAARLSVVGDAARIKEYERAQQQAEAFRDAGYVGDTPSNVASWAAAKEWTPQEACDDILAAADRWLAALDGIRALRLQAKEDVRRTTDAALVASIVATFTATLTAAMQGVA